MTPVDKVRQEADAAVLVPPVVLDEMDQEVDLRLGLDEEGFLALDDLDGHLAIRLLVDGPNDLPEGTLPYPLLEVVSSVEELPGLEDVVIVLIVEAVVVNACTGHTDLLSLCEGLLPSFLVPLLVVEGVDALVRLDEADGKLVDRPLVRLPYQGHRRSTRLSLSLSLSLSRRHRCRLRSLCLRLARRRRCRSIGGKLLRLGLRHPIRGLVLQGLGQVVRHRFRRRGRLLRRPLLGLLRRRRHLPHVVVARGPRCCHGSCRHRGIVRACLLLLRRLRCRSLLVVVIVVARVHGHGVAAAGFFCLGRRFLRLIIVVAILLVTFIVIIILIIIVVILILILTLTVAVILLHRLILILLFVVVVVVGRRFVFFTSCRFLGSIASLGLIEAPLQLVDVLPPRRFLLLLHLLRKFSSRSKHTRFFVCFLECRSSDSHALNETAGNSYGRMSLQESNRACTSKKEFRHLLCLCCSISTPKLPTGVSSAIDFSPVFVSLRKLSVPCARFASVVNYSFCSRSKSYTRRTPRALSPHLFSFVLG
mmetsp:Transcript_16533/g.47465  ORF Transcript_16533/g.47465 Transcript_16533/m.47465 type:complete len:534 (+) Transcript_16533:1279-2880(+)